MKKLIYFVCSLILFSCTNKNANSTLDYFNLTSYLDSQIKVLNKDTPKIFKTTSKKGELENAEYVAKDWKKELAAFYEYDLNRNPVDSGYTKEVFASGRLSVEQYTNSSEKGDIELFKISKNQGKIELIEIHVRKNNWIVNRSMVLSYMPMKAFRISGTQKYFWNSEPKEFETDVQIEDPRYINIR